MELALFLLVLILAPLVGIGAAQALRKWFAPGARFCPACGHVGGSRPTLRGSLALELLLYFFFLLPGIVYSLWRHSTKFQACERCGQPGMIPADSPRARAALSQPT